MNKFYIIGGVILLIVVIYFIYSKNKKNDTSSQIDNNQNYQNTQQQNGLMQYTGLIDWAAGFVKNNKDLIKKDEKSNGSNKLNCTDWEKEQYSQLGYIPGVDKSFSCA